MSLKDYTFFGKNAAPQWPENENGEQSKPVFLEHFTGSTPELEMELNMLHAYGIPTVYKYPNDGDFAKVILGFAPTGVDIFVPEELSEDAKNIISYDSGAEPEEIAEEAK